AHMAAAIGLSFVTVGEIEHSAAVLAMKIADGFFDLILDQPVVARAIGVEDAAAEEAQPRTKGACAQRRFDVAVEGEAGHERAVPMFVLGAQAGDEYLCIASRMRPARSGWRTAAVK